MHAEEGGSITNILSVMIQTGCHLFQVGFMKDGRIMAAEIQYFTNAGNTVDESVLVGKSSVSVTRESDTKETMKL